MKFVCVVFSFIIFGTHASGSPLGNPYRVDHLQKFTFGKIDAPFKIIEFSTVSCPGCASFHLNTLPALIKKYVDTGIVHYTIYDFPTDQVTLKVTGLIHCLGPKHAWKMREHLFDTQVFWLTKQDPAHAVDDIVIAQGIDAKQVKQCHTDERFAKEVMHHVLELGKSYGIPATPTFVIIKGTDIPIKITKVPDLKDFDAILQSTDAAKSSSLTSLTGNISSSQLNPLSKKIAHEEAGPSY